MTKKRFPIVLIIATTCFVLYVASFTTMFVLIFVLLEQTPDTKITKFSYALKVLQNSSLQSEYAELLIVVYICQISALVTLVTTWISLYRTQPRIFPACMLALTIPGAAWAIYAIVYLIVTSA